MLCNSLLFNGGKLQIEKLPSWPNSAVSGLKLPLETSVLKLAPGTAIEVDQTGFAKLTKAFFAEIEKRYG